MTEGAQGTARLFIVSDCSGVDDEGMKRIAWSLSSELSSGFGIDCRLVSPRELALGRIRGALVHFIGGPSWRTVVAAAWCKHVRGAAGTILTFTNPFWNCTADVLVRTFRPDRVVVSSQHWREWASKMCLAWTSLPVSGVDPLRFRKVSSETKRKLRDKWNFRESETIVLHVGHLKEDRNLAGLSMLARETVFTVVVVGSTSTSQSESIVSNLEASGCRVVTEYLPDIEEIYQLADCYLFPTTDKRGAVEMPLSVLEAAACGLPIVSTRYGGLPEYLGGWNGCTFIPDDLPVSELAERVGETINVRPIKPVPHNMSWKESAGSFLELYDELLVAKQLEPLGRQSEGQRG